MSGNQSGGGVDHCCIQDRHLQQRGELCMSKRTPFVPFPTPRPLPSLSWTLQDRRWVKEDEESAANRGKSKPSTWFRCLLTLGCAVAQLSGQTATDSCQLELLEPHSLRHLSSAALFYACELASLPGYCWLWSLFLLRQCWRAAFHFVQEQTSVSLQRGLT